MFCWLNAFPLENAKCVSSSITIISLQANDRFTDNLNALHGVEGRELKGGALRWGWKEVYEDGEPLYQAQCEVISGPFLFLITATCADPGDLGQVAELIGRVAVVQNRAREETVQAKKE